MTFCDHCSAAILPGWGHVCDGAALCDACWAWLGYKVEDDYVP